MLPFVFNVLLFLLAFVPGGACFNFGERSLLPIDLAYLVGYTEFDGGLKGHLLATGLLQAMHRQVVDLPLSCCASSFGCFGIS